MSINDLVFFGREGFFFFFFFFLESGSDLERSIALDSQFMFVPESARRFL